MLKFLSITFALLGAVLAAPSSDIITPQLESALRGGGRANIFITMKAGTSDVLANIQNSQFADRSTKLNALAAALRNHAQRTQQPILSFLEKSGVQLTSYWITNQIYIKNVDSTLVRSLANEFPDLISQIDEEFFAHLIQPVSIQTNVSRTNADHQWGVTKIQAPEAWAELGGVTNAGEGVVIATVDTGVRGTHEALRNNFLGEYGWFDPSDSEGKEPTPSDYNGHGTHTTGTIAGGLGIGVAPKSKWSACRGCASFFCSQPDLLKCGEFFVCPTLTDGSKPDCSKAPNVVSNSWGGGRGNTWYNGVIEAWHAAGIIPVFSIGNSGPSCNTANSPGDQNVIGVGSTTVDDEISYFSSVGPTSDGRMKPEIAAPGSDVISAYHTADDAYASLSGTSMAAPHASGTIALLLTRKKGERYDGIKKLLVGNADQDLAFSGRVCEGVGDDQFPNHVFGNGRINALRSIRAQTKLL